MRKNLNSKLDLISTIVPLFGVLILSFLFLFFPYTSTIILTKIRKFLSDDLAFYYIYLGISTLILSIYIAFSKYGKVKLGDKDSKKEYSSFSWGVMIFTSTMAADILFYSLCEWALYASEKHIENIGGIQKWALTYSLFHWGPIAWSFYIILAVCFGFMLHVRKREKQKFSEGLRPLFKNKIDGFLGKIIDLFAIFALISGTATTFSLATPLLSGAISKIFYIQNNNILTLFILILIAFIYTLAVWFGMDGVLKLSNYCSYLFIILLCYFLFLSGETKYIIETAIESIGNMFQNFIFLSTSTDPLRVTNFTENFTVYYWSYWIVWCVATPFFIGKISKGRTIKETILGGYFFGLLGTFSSFMILGGYGLSLHFKKGIDILNLIKNNNLSFAILKIFDTLPLSKFAILILIVTMILFYSTTFDALTMVISSYSYKKLSINESPNKNIRVFWSIVFILLPISLIFMKKSMYSLQSVSIIAAFPIGFIIILLIISFFKDCNKFLKENKK